MVHFYRFIICLTIAYCCFAVSAESSSCDSKIQSELLTLLEEDENNILPLQFQVTMLKVLKQSTQSNKKSIEQHLKKNSEKLHRLDNNNPDILKKLENLYVNESIASKTIFQNIDKLKSKSINADYKNSSKRLTNQDLSSMLMADILQNKESKYSKRDIAITWYMQKIAEKVKENENGKSFTMNQNMMQLSNRLARYTGAMGDAETASLPEIDQEIKRASEIINKFTNEALTKLKEDFPECFSSDAPESNCKDLEIFNKNLSDLILNSNDIVDKTFDKTFDATLSLARKSIPKVEKIETPDKKLEPSENSCMSIYNKKHKSWPKNKYSWEETYIPCFIKQKQLWGTYSHNLKQAIRTLHQGINHETLKGTDPELVDMLKYYMHKLIIEHVYISNMYQQMNESLNKDKCGPPPKMPQIQEGFVTQKYILKSICNTLGGCEKPDGITKTLAEKTLDNIIKDAEKFTAKTVARGVLRESEKVVFRFIAGKITPGTIGSSLAGLGLDLFTFPLKGHTIPNDHKWKEAALENPSILLNPAWYMSVVEGSSQPNPSAGWRAHCQARRDYKDKMNKMIYKLKDSPLSGTESNLKALFEAYHRDKIRAAKATYDPEAEKFLPKNTTTPSDTIELYEQNEDSNIPRHPSWMDKFN